MIESTMIPADLNSNLAHHVRDGYPQVLRGGADASVASARIQRARQPRFDAPRLPFDEGGLAPNTRWLTPSA
jgi:hypothetical protein